MLLAESECSTLTDMLLSGVRLDGRSLKEYREINFNFPTGHPSGGCCIVKIGSTSVLAKVTAEIVEPKHYRPAQGMLFLNFDASVISTNEARKKNRTRDDEGRRLSSVLQTCFRDCIDLDALCIVAWERVFAIRVDLRALSFDGNLGDCGALAAVTALATFRRPDVYVGDDGKVIVDTEEAHRPPIRLALRRIPVLVTLGLASDTKVILQDPSKREECILTGGRVMVGLTSHQELCCLHTSDLNTPIRPESLSRCIHLANSRARSLVALVQRVLDGFERQRYLNQSAGFARKSDLQRAKEVFLEAPLVLSSASYLPGGLNAPTGDYDVNMEEGELEFVSGSEMDISSSESEDVKSESTQPPLKRDPYGVIEVSSILQESTPCEPDGNLLSDLLTTPSLESDASALSHICATQPHADFLPPGRKGGLASRKIAKHLRKNTKKGDDEEEITSVVNLK